METKRPFPRTLLENVKEEEVEDKCTSLSLRGIQRIKNSELPVVCGTKLGLLDMKLLERGEPCIRCQGGLFTPPAFEGLAGKGTAKKWKASIFYRNRPLQHWFELGVLSTKGYKKKIKSVMRILPSKNEPEGLSNGGSDESEDEEQEKNVMEVCVKTENWDDDDDDDATDISNYQEEVVTQENPARNLSPENFGLQKELKIYIKRLPVTRTDSLTNSMEHLPDFGNESLNENNQPTDDNSLSSDGYPCTSMHNHLSAAAGSDEETQKRLKQLVLPRPIKTEECSYEENQDEELEMCYQNQIKLKEQQDQQLSGSQFNNQSHARECGDAASTTQKQPLSMENIQQSSQADVLHTMRHMNHTHATSQLQRMTLDMRAPNRRRVYNKVESSSGVRSSSYREMMEFRRLKRQKIEMQLRVLKVQEQYYTAKLNMLKQIKK